MDARDEVQNDSMRSTLQKLIHACHGDERPDCPILGGIAGETT